MVTDRRRLGQHAEDALIRRVGIAARAGIHFIQIRERDMADGALFDLVQKAVAAVGRTRARVLVNDRVDVALAAGAHGVHLRGDSVPAPRVRTVTPPGFVLGRSVHTRDEVAALSAEDAVDYLLFGTVFETASKPAQPATGVAGFANAASAAGRVPMLAVGGVTAENLARLAGSGCAGFAAIGLFSDGPEDDLATTVTAALAAWENPR
jgi:thiamine-phosphate pyrophosphorylase